MIKIGKPFTPSTIIKSKTIECRELTLSCPAGMGGRCWEVYTKNDINLNERFIKIDTNLDKNLIVNTNFIVQIKQVKILKITVRNDGNNNIDLPVGATRDYCFVIPLDEKVTLTESYGDDNKSLKRVTYNE
jgi:hypothetical protein